jgi:hypothetical protein
MGSLEGEKESPTDIKAATVEEVGGISPTEQDRSRDRDSQHVDAATEARLVRKLDLNLLTLVSVLCML